MQTNSNALRTAFVYGLVTGVALGISEIALVFVLFLVPYPLAFFVGRLAQVLLILAYFYAGYQASRRTGQVLVGTLAGALTGAFGVLTVVAFSYIAAAPGMSLILNPQSFMGLPVGTLVASPLLSPLTRIVLTVAFYGAIAGTLAGFIGKQRSLH